MLKYHTMYQYEEKKTSICWSFSQTSIEQKGKIHTRVSWLKKQKQWLCTDKQTATFQRLCQISPFLRVKKKSRHTHTTFANMFRKYLYSNFVQKRKINGGRRGEKEEEIQSKARIIRMLTSKQTNGRKNQSQSSAVENVMKIKLQTNSSICFHILSDCMPPALVITAHLICLDLFFHAMHVSFAVHSLNRSFTRSNVFLKLCFIITSLYAHLVPFMLVDLKEIAWENIRAFLLISDEFGVKEFDAVV